MSRSAFSCGQNLLVGKTRVRDIDGFCGTVEYHGPVASAKNQSEIYAGISWDDPSRGKHNGTVICRNTKQLVRHFSSSGGSFLKISKVDTGIPLNLSVLQTKYVEPDAPLLAPRNILPHSARTSSGREKKIELYGEIELRGQQGVHMLSRISLRNTGLSSIDPSFHGLTQVLDLDLGGNLFCDWDILPGILHAFPNLSCLSLAANRLGDLRQHPGFVHERLSHLNVCSCGVRSFATIQHLNEAFPSIEQLCAAGNDLSDLASIETVYGFRSLSRLDISTCGLTSWNNHVMKLSDLPCLETLLINYNPIDLIPVWTDNGKFQELKNLSMTGIDVADWNDLEGLQSLPCLHSLSLRDTPLTSSIGTSEARFMIIARFSEITTLNSSVISVKERADAEKRYVAHVIQELLRADKVGMDKEAFLSTSHPRFSRLVDELQQDMNRLRNVAGSRNVSSCTVNVTITSLASESCEKEPIQKRLPISLTIGRLKALCARAFGLDFDLQVLHCRSEVRESLRDSIQWV